MNGKTDIKRYVDIFAISGGVPDNEISRQIKLVKSRVSEIFDCNLLQIYYKFTTYNTE